jgi:4-hydroxy-3-polyprenylbenzoate decarboxylase
VSFPDLRSFLADLEAGGQLKRIATAVDPVLEVAEIADRMSKSDAPEGPGGAPATDPRNGRFGGYALLFENVIGSSIPLAINTYGSYQRMYRALGCTDFEQLADRVQLLVKPEVPSSLMDKVKKLPELIKIAGFAPKSVRSGICQENVHTGDQADLSKLPIIQCWPDDGGKYVTFGGVVTKNPEEGDLNVGMYRLQIFGPRLTAMHWHMHHDGARHWRMHKERGIKQMPLAVVLGGHAVLPFAATCPLPPGISELLFAGFLAGGGIELVNCKTIELQVPASAEIVIEGWVETDGELVLEGPFGDHTGFYSLADYFPKFHVTAITHRRDPIYPTTIVGKPPMEDYYMGKAVERIFLPLLKTIVPDIVDYDLPIFGAFHNCVFIKIKKEYPLQARKIMHSIWGAGQMMLSKFIIVVDEDVDVHDQNDVLFHVGANVDPERDIHTVRGPLDILDHAAPFCGAGSKMGIDATRKIAGEGVVREWPEELVMSDEIKQRVDRRWSEFGL